jgi:hypothetical protein
MSEQTIENQTRMYLFDLMNAAKEFGFKGEDRWELGLATDAERIKIQRDNYPTLATKVDQEILLQVFNLTKQRLKQSLNSHEQGMNTRNLMSEELTHIVAFNPKRPRT